MIINKRQLFLFLFSILFIECLFAQNKTLVTFQNHFDQSQSFVADFQQLYYDAMLDQTSVSSGKIFYRKPGLMSWDYNNPDATQIIIGKEKIWIYDPDLENVTIQYLDQVSRMDALSFFLKNEDLEKHFSVTQPEKSFIENAESIIPLYLKPKKESQHIAELQLALEKNSYKIQQFILVDHQKNYRRIRFNNMVLNVLIDPSKFEFVVTEGMEVIDEMVN